MSIKITKKDLQKAQKNGVLNEQQSDALWQYLLKQKKTDHAYNFSNLMYFLGGLIAIAALTVFVGNGLAHFGKLGLMSIALLYWIGGLLAAILFHNKALKTPKEISLLFIICLTPLVIFSTLQFLNLWDSQPTFQIPGLIQLVDWHSLIIELGTLLIAILIFIASPCSLMMLPLTICGWIIATDLPNHLLTDKSLSDSANYSFIYGLLCTILAIYLDFQNHSKTKYCYWLYVVGLTAFWLGSLGTILNNELRWFLFCLSNLGFLILGILLSRKILLIYGGLGVSFYLGHLTYEFFHDSIYWPFILSLLGVLIILMGLFIQKHPNFHQTIIQKARNYLKKLSSK